MSEMVKNKTWQRSSLKTVSFALLSKFYNSLSTTSTYAHKTQSGAQLDRYMLEAPSSMSTI